MTGRENKPAGDEAARKDTSPAAASRRESDVVQANRALSGENDGAGPDRKEIIDRGARDAASHAQTGKPV